MEHTADSDAFENGLSRLKLFFALSRTPHGLIDMTTPAFAALLWLGEIPSFGVIVLGVITAFAGYTAVYALNDLVDIRLDRERLRQAGFEERTAAQDLDAALIRHPLARDMLGFGEALAWALFWSAVALIGAWALNPVCILFFLFGGLLEAAYCLLFRISPMRTAVNGVVKTLGPLAAVFAVDPSPSFLFLFVLFWTLFLWEIGGQNIPNDFGDLDEDRKLRGKTFPVRFGKEISAFAIMTFLTGALVLTFVLLKLSRIPFGITAFAILTALGACLVIVPAGRFFREPTGEHAMMLFNRASYYPAALFLLTFTHILIS